MQRFQRFTPPTARSVNYACQVTASSLNSLVNGCRFAIGHLLGMHCPLFKVSTKVGLAQTPLIQNDEIIHVRRPSLRTPSISTRCRRNHRIYAYQGVSLH